jgi:hypothetical protein
MPDASRFHNFIYEMTSRYLSPVAYELQQEFTQAAHSRHLRTTNVIESPFHAVRLRTTAAKRFKRVANATALIWKLLLVAQEQFRKLNAPHLCRDVFAGIRYRDGAPVGPSPTREPPNCSITHSLTRPRSPTT